MANTCYKHIPVLLNEAVDALNLKAGMTVVDATLGGGGHSMEIIKKIAPNGTLVAIDQDNEIGRASCRERV